jgi:hypothetical protein
MLYSYSQNTHEYLDFPMSTHGNTCVSGKYGTWENHKCSYLCYSLNMTLKILFRWGQEAVELHVHNGGSRPSAIP